ncbi:MAG: hypothetical protein RJB39_506 [Candidatus Parcubacteria bacterium]|jgi:hypothetical protein
MNKLIDYITTQIVEHIYSFSGETLMYVALVLALLLLIGLFFLLRTAIRQFRHHLNDAMKAIMIRTYISFGGLVALVAVVASLPWSKLPETMPWTVWFPITLAIPGYLYFMWLLHVWGYRKLDWKKNDIIEETN